MTAKQLQVYWKDEDEKNAKIIFQEMKRLGIEVEVKGNIGYSATIRYALEQTVRQIKEGQKQKS